jgi:hypothetical protein
MEVSRERRRATSSSERVIMGIALIVLLLKSGAYAPLGSQHTGK